MDWLLRDEPLAILEGLGLLALSVGLIVASTARGRSVRHADPIGRLYWRDLSDAGYVWAFTMGTTLVGAAAGIEGFSQPIWIVIILLAGSAGLFVARHHWRRDVSASSSDNPGSPRLTAPALASTSWEIAFTGAALGAFAVYAATVAHGWGHLIHWLIAGVGAGLGYALGLTVASPRYTVRRRQS